MSAIEPTITFEQYGTNVRVTQDWTSVLDKMARDVADRIDEATLARLGYVKQETCYNTSRVTDAYGQARFVCSECRAWIDLRVLWNPGYPNGESPWVRDCKLNYCPNCGRRIEEVDE